LILDLAPDGAIILASQQSAWARKESKVMQTAVFYGASDDLVEIEGVKGADEFNVYDTPRDATFNLGDRIRIQARYDGSWTFVVDPIGDGPLPDWPIRTSQQPDVDYSTRLEIDCPDETAVRLEEPRES
jgi:hypothetical protein